MRVLIFSEDFEVALQCIAAANSISDKSPSLATASVGASAREEAVRFADYGMDSVYFNGDARLDTYDAETVSQLLERIVRERSMEGVLIGSTRRGKEIAGRLAVRLKVGCATDCTRIYLREGSIFTERMVYGGRGLATLRFKHYPFVVTVARGHFEAARQGAVRVADPMEFTAAIDFPKKKLLHADRAVKNADISRAGIIVSVGRGFKSKEDLQMAYDLATLIGGVVACSRPISSDYGWLPEERQVGLSGRTVRPKLYLALGISGQIQHQVGMKDSGTVMAINNDPNAPMADVSDYFVEGDLYQVLPELISRLSRSQGSTKNSQTTGSTDG